MKKLLLASLTMMMLLTGCNSKATTATTTVPAETKEVSLEIIVNDEVNGEELFNDTITVEGNIESLYDFLKEVDELKLEFGEGSYGTYIDGMMGLKQDFNKGPWWLYSSENNETCQAEGMCPAVKDLKIKDGDKFVFSYTDQF
ncbi:MAG: DUF4430 domain-containing protein [Erysipelotrichaceae bacterium]|nr:DUF4430 domain-containing protein [Erysipelotrichaceae bacterium]MDY5251410.1 DUF4430 domain-containing protein [Erysipelotrichaceae bacterium]